MLQVMVGAGALVLGIIVAPILARQSLGPRSSAAIALVVFGGTLGAVVVRRRMARRSVGSDVDGDG